MRKPSKKNSKFSEAEQRAYAAGQRDARNESARICAVKNSSPEERAAYNEKRKAEQAAYKAAKLKKAAKEAEAAAKAYNAKKAMKSNNK